MPRRPCPLWLVVALAACSTSGGPGGVELLQEGDAAGAEAYFKERMREDPRNDRWRDGLGAALATQGRYAEGCPLLAPGSEPMGADDCWLKGMEEAAASGRWPQVVVFARRLNPKGWDSAKAARMEELAAEAARKTEDWALLLELYPKLLARRPDDAELHYLYARALEYRQQFDAAVREYELAAAMDPSNEDITRSLGRLEAKVAAGAAGPSAKIQRMDGGGQAPANATAGVAVEGWTSGSMSASIQIEAMEPTAETTAAVDFTVLRAHWPPGTDEAAAKRRLAARITGIRCRRSPLVGEVTVVVGPEGTVSRMEVDNLPGPVETCLRREIRGWIVGDLKGGFLKLSFPYPLPDSEAAAAP